MNLELYRFSNFRALLSYGACVDFGQMLLKELNNSFHIDKLSPRKFDPQ